MSELTSMLARVVTAKDDNDRLNIYLIRGDRIIPKPKDVPWPEQECLIPEGISEWHVSILAEDDKVVFGDLTLLGPLAEPELRDVIGMLFDGGELPT